MKIGILQAGHLPEEVSKDFGSYGELYTQFLTGFGFTFEIYVVVDGHFPTNAADADGWLITGSKHGAYEDHPWIASLEEFIRQAYGQNIPIVGICFGHQVVAQALGGKVEKFKDGWAVGPTQYQIDGFEPDLSMMAWHQDQVVIRPKDAQVIGASPFCQNAILAYGNKAYTVQPHPEFGDDFVSSLIKHRGRGVVPAAQLQSAQDKLGTPLANQMIAQKLADFFHQPRQQEA